MLVCLEHLHCEHQVPVCQCNLCWSFETQCPYAIQLCDHYIPDYIPCKACLEDDATSSSNLSAVDMDGLAADAGHMANRNNKIWETFMDIAEEVCHQSNGKYNTNADTDVTPHGDGTRCHNLSPHLPDSPGTIERLTVAPSSFGNAGKETHS